MDATRTDLLHETTETTPVLEAERRASSRPAPGSPDTPPPPSEETTNSRRTSTLLREFLAAQTGPRVNFGDLRDALDDRGFGVLLFIFAFPNLIPVNIPLLSSVLGLPLVLLAAQLTYGRHKPWFPRWLTAQTFPREKFTVFLSRALPYLERTERLFRPRLTVLLSWTAERLIGFFLLILAVVLALPIPFGNWLPAFAIAIIGLAMVERDGLAVLAGIGIGVGSLIVAAAVVTGMIKAFLLLLSLA